MSQTAAIKLAEVACQALYKGWKHVLHVCSKLDGKEREFWNSETSSLQSGKVDACFDAGPISIGAGKGTLPDD